MQPPMNYLHNETLLKDMKEADRIKKRFGWFLLYEGILYKKVFSYPLLRCAISEEGKRISAKI